MTRLAYAFVVYLAVTSCPGAEPFQDVTEAVGLQGLSAGVVAWGDFDDDGWVDLYASGQLWRNERGKFERIQDVPLEGPGIWGDFDNDGFPLAVPIKRA